MAWNAPYILWYLPLALLPVAIYYWMRMHPVSRCWGAHYVLDLALQKLKRKLINEHVLLLALRVLMALLLILAFARFALRDDRDAEVVRSSAHRVIIFDTSYSMLAGNTGQTRWDVAVKSLRRLIATAGRGESWSLYVMGDAPGWLVEYAVVGEDTEAVATFDDLQPSESPASLARALRAVGERFTLQHIDLFLLVDDQATTWQNVADLAATTPPRHTYWVNGTPPSRVNTAITGVHAANERCLTGQPTRIFVDLQHYSDTANDVTVEFLQDGEAVATKTVSLQPRLPGRTFFDARFNTSGPHYAQARLRPDALSYDDEHTVGLHAESELNVLILAEPEPKAWRTTAMIFVHFDFVQVDRKGPSAKIMFSMERGECTAATFADKDVVFIDAGTPVDANLAALLVPFVERGGGLVLCAGVGTDADAWNAAFGPVGLLPARLGARPDWKFQPSKSRYKRISYHGFGDHALEAFATLDTGRLGEVRFYHWFDLEYPQDQVRSEDILVRFDDHRPLIMRQRVKRGRVILFASDLNGMGNTLPVRETFVPFAYRLFREAAAGGLCPRVLGIGEPLRYRAQATTAPDALALQFQGEKSIPMKLEKNGQVTTGVHADGLPRSGLARVLSVRGGTVTQNYFGIQGARQDSDLTPVDEATKSVCIATWQMTEVTDEETLMAALLADQGGRELYPWIMLALLPLMFLEMGYQKRFVRRLIE